MLFSENQGGKVRTQVLGLLVGICVWPVVAQLVRNLIVMQETQVQSLSGEDPLKEEMATHSSILAWRCPWTEIPWLQSMGSQRVRLDFGTKPPPVKLMISRKYQGSDTIMLLKL